MRIRKVWNDTKAHYHDLSVPPWLQILQRSPPIMISRINSSICSNQNPVTEEGSSTEGKSTSVHGDKCSSSINTKTSAASSVSSSLSRNGLWCDEEKVFPLKKRRLILERFITQEFENENNNNNNNRTSSECVLKRFKHEIKKKEYDEVDQIKKKNMGLRCARRNEINQKAKGSTWFQRRHRRHINPNDDFNHGGNGKKKARIRRISSILNRTMPLISNGNGGIQI